MPTTTERVDDIAAVQLGPTIDGRASIEFERQATSELDAGTRRFAIDFSKVTLITSAGIRVLLLLTKRTASEGGIALFGMSDRVKTLLDIAGLTKQFTIVGSREEAIAHLRRVHRDAPAQQAPASTISRLLLRLLGGGQREAAEASPGASATGSGGEASPLTMRVMDLLGLGGGRKT